MRRKRENKGFTLVELALVLIAIGILVGVGAGILGTLIKGAKYRESREILYRLSDSVLGRVYSSKSVPQNPFTFSPSRDAFGNDLYYVYANISDVCSATSTTLRLCRNGTANCTDNILYVVLAKGGNYNLQSSIPTGGTYDPNGGYYVSGDNFNVVVYDYGTQNIDSFSDTNDVSRAEEYDDIYDFRTLEEVKARVCPPPSSGGSSSGGNTCTTIAVVNNGAGAKDKYIDPSDPTCTNFNNNQTATLSSGDTLYIFPNGWCPWFFEASITFDNACQIDLGGNQNGQICYDGVSFSDC